MPDNVRRENTRVLKTHAALIEAMSKLLTLWNFNQISVNDLCGEAQISRTTFYSHFNDKYDFLRYWLADFELPNISKAGKYASLERSVNEFVNNNSKLIKHLMEEANSETLELMCDFIVLQLDISVSGDALSGSEPRYLVLSQFAAGGIMNYLSWQVKNRFPGEIQFMNRYFYAIIRILRKWFAEL